MLIATTLGINDGVVIDMEELIAYGLQQIGHTIIKYDWHSSEDGMLDIMSKADIAFVPVSELTRWSSNFNNRLFIEKLNSLKCKVVLEVVDEPSILPLMEDFILLYYKRMIWPHTNQLLDRYINCEKIIKELIVGEHYCYHPEDREKQYDVVFSGNIYSFRIDFLKFLVEKLNKNINFKILSPYRDIGIDNKYWMSKSGKWFSHYQLNDIYNESKIAMTLGAYDDFDVNIPSYSEGQLKNIDSIKGRGWGYPCRVFSFTGAGAFTLMDQKKECERYFKKGIEIDTYNSVDECIEKINYYLEHDEERIKIANGGYERYLKDHTIEIRMKKVLEAING